MSGTRFVPLIVRRYVESAAGFIACLVQVFVESLACFLGLDLRIVKNFACIVLRLLGGLMSLGAGVFVL